MAAQRSAETNGHRGNAPDVRQVVGARRRKHLTVGRDRQGGNVIGIEPIRRKFSGPPSRERQRYKSFPLANAPQDPSGATAIRWTRPKGRPEREIALQSATFTMKSSLRPPTIRMESEANATVSTCPIEDIVSEAATC
jgi:hypothetical protein